MQPCNPQFALDNISTIPYPLPRDDNVAENNSSENASGSGAASRPWRPSREAHPELRTRNPQPESRASAPNCASTSKMCTYLHLCALMCTSVRKNKNSKKWCTNRTQLQTSATLFL